MNHFLQNFIKSTHISMRRTISTFLQASLLVFVVFGCMLLHAQSVYAKEDVKERTKVLASKTYVIEEKDVLAISVFEEPDLSVSLKVAENGTIALPLIREVEVKGLTTYEIEQKLEKHLKDGEFLINPWVSVKLDISLMTQYGDKEIFVIGAVNRPGPIKVMGKYITALEAVAMAGGFDDMAAPGRTTVTRVEEGQEKTLVVNLKKVKRGDKSLDILLKTGDTVIVPESRF